MNVFSKKDQYILFELSMNARISINKIAKKVGMSQQGIMYRIKKFEEEGVISGYDTIFDYASLGYSSYKCLFSLISSKKDSLEQFLSHLQKINSISNILELSGEWDYMVTFLTKNASQCSKEIQKLVSIFPKQIRKYEIFTNIVTYDFGRFYLTDFGSHSGAIVLGGDRILPQIDVLETHIIKELHNQTRISSVKIASKEKVNPKTILAKIRSLETKGIIKGYKANVNCQTYSYLPQKILLKCFFLNFEKEEFFLKFCQRHTSVVQVSKVFGAWDFEIHSEFKTQKDAQQFFIDIKSQLGDLIKFIEVCSLGQHHKNKTLPENYFLSFK